MRNRSVLVPTNDTKSPCRFHVPASRQRRDQIVVGLRAIRRTGPVLHRAGDEDHGVARHRKLALAALAPELQDHLAAVADLQIRYPLGAGLAADVERHFRAERKLVIGVGRIEGQGGGHQQQRPDTRLKHARERYHATSRTIKTPAPRVVLLNNGLNGWGRVKGVPLKRCMPIDEFPGLTSRCRIRRRAPPAPLISCRP